MDRQWKIVIDHETDEWVVLQADHISVDEGVLKLWRQCPDDKELSELLAAFHKWSSVWPHEAPISEQPKEPMP